MASIGLHLPIADTIGLYPFLEDVLDASGAARDLSVLGAGPKFGRFWPKGPTGALFEPGTDNGLESADAAFQALTGDFSVAAVVSAGGLSTAGYVLFQQSGPRASETEANNCLWGLRHGYNQGAYEFFCEHDGGTSFFGAFNQAPGLDPHHLLLVREEDVVRLWVNNVLAGELTSVPAPTGGTSSKLRIAQGLSVGSSQETPATFEGAMSSLMIVGRAMTSDERNAAFAQTLGRIYPTRFA